MFFGKERMFNGFSDPDECLFMRGKMEDNRKKEYLCSPVRVEARILPGCIAGPVSVRTEIGYAESKK